MGKRLARAAAAVMSGPRVRAGHSFRLFRKRDNMRGKQERRQGERQIMRIHGARSYPVPEVVQVVPCPVNTRVGSSAGIVQRRSPAITGTTERFG
jgi:hypothetical protein